jgi:hypothetical protein
MLTHPDGNTEEEWYTGTSEECTPVKDTAGSEMEPKDLIPNAREQARMLAVSEPMHSKSSIHRRPV